MNDHQLAIKLAADASELKRAQAEGAAGFGNLVASGEKAAVALANGLWRLHFMRRLPQLASMDEARLRRAYTIGASTPRHPIIATRVDATEVR